MLFVQEAFSQAQRNNYNQTVKACENMSKRCSDHVEYRRIFALSNCDEVLYEELYKGFRYSVDASLSKALENLLASMVPDTTVPGAPFSGQVAWLDKVVHILHHFA